MRRRLLRNGTVVTDEWRTTHDGDDLADDSPLILSFAEWSAERNRWLARRGPLGVILAPADDVQKLAPDLARLALAGADFPALSEGRGYTQGRLLRERWHFAGELRARGALHRDHVFLLARCGFDSIELPESELEAAVPALRTFSGAYQPSNDLGLGLALRQGHPGI